MGSTIVGVLGVLGTLGAAIFTQVWSAKREDKRLERQRETDLARWQREQSERRDLWAREDHARWLSERKAVYAEFLRGINTWSQALSKAEDQLHFDGSVNDKRLARLQTRYADVRLTYEALSIISPDEITELAGIVTFNYVRWQGELESGQEGFYDHGKFSEDIRLLRAAIKADLIIDPARP